MKRDTAEGLIAVISVGFALLIMCALGFAVAMGIAWAITSIWPSVPFWPAAIGIFLLSGLFSRSSSK